MALPGVLTFTTNTIVALASHKSSLPMEYKSKTPIPAARRRSNPFARLLPIPRTTNTNTNSVVSLDLNPLSLPNAPFLLQTGDFSDCTIIAGHREFRLHKNIICYASDFFMKAFTTGMSETASSRIELRDEAEHPNDIGRMIKCMYEGDYRSPEENTALAGGTRTLTSCFADHCNKVQIQVCGANHNRNQAELVQLAIDAVWLDIRMYSLGNKYMIASLKAFALGQFTKNLESNLLHPSRALRRASEVVTVPGSNAKNNTVLFTPSHPSTVPTILSLARRTFLPSENTDLSAAHADAVFEFVYGMYPCLSKFPVFRRALSGELAELAARILWRATPVRAEKLVEKCEGCRAELREECALEMVAFCCECKVARRVEDMTVNPRAFEVSWAEG